MQISLLIGFLLLSGSSSEAQSITNVPKPSTSAQTQQAADSKEKPPALQEKKIAEDTKAVQEERPKAGEEQRKAAQELWQKALVAEGGLDVLNAIKTRVATGQASLFTPGETLNGPMTTVVAYPDRISRQFTVGGNTVFRTLVKEDLWIFTTKARQITMVTGALKPEKPNAEGLQLKMLLEADPVAFFVLGSDSNVEKTPLDPLEGMPGLKVKLSTGHVFVAYFNPKTFLLERLIYSVRYYGETTLKYSDFRPVSGIQVPFKMEIFRGSAKTEEQLISEVNLNVPVPEDTFRAPR
jgi:hypothetical protein